MYQVELNIVNNIKKEYDETLSLPADEFEIKRISKVFCEVFNIDVPQAYLEFLRQCNGFEFNGCIILLKILSKINLIIPFLLMIILFLLNMI